ncbi:MAG: AMP-binding protein, partial [bacterium]|nr:AMP-binding protein [bacterium]
YVIYTSGSTGKPKGMLIEHRNVVRLMKNDKYPFQFSTRDVWTMFHSYCFDFSVWEMYGALLYGGRLIIVPRTTAMDPVQYFALMQKEQVTVLNQTPSAFFNLANTILTHTKLPPKELTAAEPPLSLKYIIFGGEALNPAELEEWQARYPAVKIVNMYGITETTVHVTYKEIGPPEISSGRSNIGRPIPTLSTYVMDKQLNILPLGVQGELTVGGDGVGRGYVNRVELTHEKFVANPYKPGERLYRSGDSARRLETGDMEYGGRIDQQVKIRGFRVEPAEIENHMLKHPEIKSTVVVPRRNKTGETYLCAYYTAHSKTNEKEQKEKTTTLTLYINAKALREYLAQTLPHYMIPAHFMSIESIPLNLNGKVDIAALPEPRIEAAIQHTAPRTGIEKNLATLWAEILSLKKEEIGIDADFFELGGHSLKATTLISGIHKKLEVRIPLPELFKTPTIRQLARYIKEKEKDKYAALEPVEQKDYYPLSAPQKRIYILRRMDRGGVAYNMPESILLPQGSEIEKLEKTILRLIERHESLRTSFHMKADEPVQRIHKHVAFKIETIEHEPGDKTRSTFFRPFDITRPPLLRAGLLKEPGGTARLLIDMHHIITDGISQAILKKEFNDIFEGEEPEPLRLQYKDYSEWCNSKEQKEKLRRQEDYWLKVFVEKPPALNLPLDYPRPREQSFEGDSIGFRIEAEEVKKLKELAIKYDITLYMALLAQLNILLSKLTGQKDIVVGTPVAGRRHADLENIIGMFVNTLPLRNDVTAKKTYAEMLHPLKENLLEAFENQEYPFEELVTKLPLNRDTSRNPLFDIMYTLERFDGGHGTKTRSKASPALKER